MRKHLKRLLSLVIVAALAVSLAAPAFAAGPGGNAGGRRLVASLEKVENGVGMLTPTGKVNLPAEEPLYADDEVVRVSIVLNSVSTLEKGYSTKGIAGNSSAMAYRQVLKDEQAGVTAAISRQALGGEELDVVWNLTLAANIISANVPYGKIGAIKAVEGVKDVVLETQYLPAVTEKADGPNMGIATDMTGTQNAYDNGYTGAGSKVAIIDTGLDTDHEMFDAESFEFSLWKGGKTDVDLMDADDITAVFNELNIITKIRRLNPDQLYLTSKVPFAANYVDGSLDVTHDNDTQGEHGSHVAGIAAANRYIPAPDPENGNDSFASALTAVNTQGQAPDAQLMIMKVFGRGGGAYDSDYMVAIEDAMILGADSVNLSLGSANAGSPYNSTYSRILNQLTQSDTVVTISSGNSYHWATFAEYGYLYADGGNFAAGGSTGTYTNAFTVASVENDGVTGIFMTVDGQSVFYTETGTGRIRPMSSLAGDREFIYVDCVGDITQLRPLADLIRGKVLLVNRGEINFTAKGNNAVSVGAAAVIVVNNQPGTISMSTDGYTGTIPYISITQDDGELFKNAGTEAELGDQVYYTGTFHVGDTVGAVNFNSEFYTMSDFSSWGVPSNLTLKPEITAPGGNIYSVNGAVAGGHAYESMSGTSMAAPQIAGISAVFAEYIRENNLVEVTGQSERFLIHSLLMSTATPLVDGESGFYYPVIQQGSGLANIAGAIAAKGYISMGADATASYADGKVKAELGDDPERTGVYSFSFSVNNFSDVEQTYLLSGEFFTQDIFDGGFALFLDTWTYPLLSAKVVFDGAEAAYEDVDGELAQAILDYVAKGIVPEGSEDFTEAADLSGDGVVDAYDAYLALGEATYTVTVPAGESREVTVTVSFDTEELEEYGSEELNGAWIEGYVFAERLATEDETAEDVLVDEIHSIPVVAYYGGWDEPEMTDVGSYLEYATGTETRLPYLYSVLGTENVEGFVDGEGYFLGGNPFVDDGFYDPERNAVNTLDSIVSMAQYSLVRNAGASYFVVFDDEGNVLDAVAGSTASRNTAYYHVNQARWYNTYTTFSYGRAVNAGDSESITYAVYLVPEYYADYDVETGVASYDFLSVLENVAPAMTYTTAVDNVAPQILKVEPGVVDQDVVINVRVQDNRYVAAVAMENESGSLFEYFGSVEDAVAGQELTYSFNIDMLDPANAHLLIEAYDFAGNYSTYRLNLRWADEQYDDIVVTLNTTEARIINNGSVQLSASVEPWGASEAIVWSSDSEDIVVNDRGVVTNVSGENGATATIRATSAANPEAYAECLVTVEFLDQVLNGVIWDEEGEVWFSEFNLGTLPDYTKLNEESLEAPIASLAYDKTGTLYGVTFDSEEWTSYVYTVNETTWELTELAYSDIGYMDICFTPNLGNYMLAVYGPYVLNVNKTTGQMAGYFDWSNYTGGNELVGIAYESTVTANRRNNDYVWVVDVTGNVYRTYFYASGTRVSMGRPTNVGQIGNAVDTPYFQSLYFDGENLFWSRFSQAENDVDLIMVYDVFNDGSVYNLGSFADSVWPVGGLYESGVNPALGFAPNPNATYEINDAEAVEMSTEPIEPLAVRAPLVPMEPVVGLHSAAGLLAVQEPEEEEDPTEPVEGTASVKAGVAGNYGQIAVEYDAEELTFVSAESLIEEYSSYGVNAEDGVVTFAYATLDAIEEGQEILVLTFASATGEETYVTVTYASVGEYDAADDAEEPVVFEEPEPESPFVDVDPEDWAYEYIYDVWQRGLMNGTGNDKFHPERELTRGEAITVFYRLAGEPEVEGENPFSDVEEGLWYTDAVIWAAENGIVNGTGNGKFHPERNMTRQEFAVMAYRVAQKYLNATAPECELDYTDAGDVSSWAVDAVKWCAENDILNDYDDGSLKPTATATRAECAYIFSQLAALFD